MTIWRIWGWKDLHCFSRSRLLSFEMCFKVILGQNEPWAVRIYDRIEARQCEKKSIDKHKQLVKWIPRQMPTRHNYAHTTYRLQDKIMFTRQPHNTNEKKRQMLTTIYVLSIAWALLDMQCVTVFWSVLITDGLQVCPYTDVRNESYNQYGD